MAHCRARPTATIPVLHPIHLRWKVPILPRSSRTRSEYCGSDRTHVFRSQSERAADSLPFEAEPMAVRLISGRSRSCENPDICQVGAPVKDHPVGGGMVHALRIGGRRRFVRRCRLNPGGRPCCPSALVRIHVSFKAPLKVLPPNTIIL